MEGLRPGLNVLEWVLGTVFLVHIFVTYLLVLENITARGGVSRYAVHRPVGNRSWATRLMAYSGFGVFAFVLWHLLDFTFVEHEGPRSILPDGHSYGLYGIVYNAFRDPLHSVLYILAMICVGLHLYHGVESFMQTLGLNDSSYALMIKTFSKIFSVLITLGYSSIPIYVLIDSQKFHLM